MIPEIAPSKKPRKSYHTHLKFLVKFSLLSDAYLAGIHRSLICKWKKEAHDKYVGHELNALVSEKLEVLQKFAHDKAAQKAFEIYLVACKAILGIASKIKGFKSKLRQSKAGVVEAIEKLAETISLSRAVQCFDISLSTYYAWYTEVKKKCRHSTIGFCLKTYPQQLTNKETGLIQKLLTDESFQFWPSASVYYYAVREKMISFALSTWYRYARMLGIQRPQRPKKLKRIGIHADRPHAIWHADVSIIKLANGTKAYFYAVVDNFSRHVLSWRCTLELSAATRLETIQKALHFVPIELANDIDLIVDGGTENNNYTVEEWLKDQPLQKLIALTDIRFSNSCVESFFKVIKKYLIGKEFYSIESLRDELGHDIKDYSIIRPHMSLKGLTPAEACAGIVPADPGFAHQIAEARIARLEINRQNACQACII